VIKIPLHSQLADLGVEPGKLGLSARIGACPTTENRGRTIKQLLLPGVNLIRVKLIFGRQRGNPRLIPQRLQRDLFAFNPASSRRLVFLLIRSAPPRSHGADFHLKPWSYFPDPLLGSLVRNIC
jgi:hypothetical protein